MTSIICAALAAVLMMSATSVSAFAVSDPVDAASTYSYNTGKQADEEKHGRGASVV